MKHLLFCFSLMAFSCSAQQMPVIPSDQLDQDLTILVSALKEAHTGIFWYTSEAEFDKMEAEMRARISENGGQTALEFYNTIAPYVAMTKEDHCDISLSVETGKFLAEHGRYFPFPVKFSGGTPYLIGTTLPQTMDLNGCELLTVNDIPVSQITEQLFATFASDGNILTSKFRWLDDIGFARLYAKTIDWNTEQFKLLVRRPEAKTTEYITITPVSFAELAAAFKTLDNPLFEAKKPADLIIKPDYAVLTVRTFSSSDYREHNMRFESFIDSCFKALKTAGTQSLIIDVRANGGGTEGYEDYLFSWLTARPYNKYRFVETNALTYSFFDYTDYADPEERKDFEKLLRKEFQYDAATGKYRRKEHIERPEKPKKHPFTGNLYVLAGGVTYSGGAEFSSIVRYNRKAVFVGEEVGGGYYGNTSGYSMTLTLPYSKIRVEIPIVRFVLDVDGQPDGTGVLPDYPIQPRIDHFLNGIDTELEFAIDLVRTPPH